MTTQHASESSGEIGASEGREQMTDGKALIAELTTENARLTAELAEVTRQRDGLLGAVSWIEPPFVDASTSADELRKRIGFCVADAARARALTDGGQP